MDQFRRYADPAIYWDVEPAAFYTIALKHGPMHMTWVNVPGHELKAWAR